MCSERWQNPKLYTRGIQRYQSQNRHCWSGKSEKLLLTEMKLMKMNKTNLPGTDSIHPRVIKEFEYDIAKLPISIHNLTFKTADMGGVSPGPCALQYICKQSHKENGH